jgi:hypothetical protein
MNRVFKPRSERPLFREWIFGMGGGAAFYSTIFIQNHDVRFWVRMAALLLALVQLSFWISLALRKRR